jgi:hypothetical protein
MGEDGDAHPRRRTRSPCEALSGRLPSHRRCRSRHQRTGLDSDVRRVAVTEERVSATGFPSQTDSDSPQGPAAPAATRQHGGPARARCTTRSGLGWLVQGPEAGSGSCPRGAHTALALLPSPPLLLSTHQGTPTAAAAADIRVGCASESVPGLLLSVQAPPILGSGLCAPTATRWYGCTNKDSDAGNATAATPEKIENVWAT